VIRIGVLIALYSVSEPKEDKAMRKKILVPLAQNDWTEDMIPYIERVARRGMNVVFLVRYPVDGFIWAKEEYDMRAAVQARQLVNYYSWENNLENAERKLSPVCEALRAKGVQATVDVYAGSLKKAVRSHMASGDVHLILQRAGIGQRIAGLLDGSSSLFELFKRPTVSTVLLTHPGMAA
jgi:hypothetical protein